MSFHREGNAVLANTSGPLMVRYISNDEDSFSALFKRALATSLAAKAASFITGKQTYAQLLTNMAANVTLQAQMRDSLQATPDHVEEADWTHARNGDFGWGSEVYIPGVGVGLDCLPIAIVVFSWRDIAEITGETRPRFLQDGSR
jgi:hypothetical protein